jgi:hypothetical protein
MKKHEQFFFSISESCGFAVGSNGTKLNTARHSGSNIRFSTSWNVLSGCNFRDIMLRFVGLPLHFSPFQCSPLSQPHFAPDIAYRCTWDALECGTVTPRFCPTVSSLSVTAVAPSINRSVSGGCTQQSVGEDGRCRADPASGQARVGLFGKVRRENVSVVDVDRRYTARCPDDQAHCQLSLRS